MHVSATSPSLSLLIWDIAVNILKEDVTFLMKHGAGDYSFFFGHVGNEHWAVKDRSSAACHASTLVSMEGDFSDPWPGIKKYRAMVRYTAHMVKLDDKDCSDNRMVADTPALHHSQAAQGQFLGWSRMQSN